MSLFVYNENAGEVYYMGRISISKVTPGMVLEADVLNEANQLILPEGLKINDKAIEKLTYYGITSVRVEGVDDDAEFLPQSDPGANTSYSDRLKKTEEYKVFKEQFESAVNEVQGFLSDVVERNMPPDTTGIMNSIQQMLHPPSGDILNVFDMIHNMKSFDDMTYVHCLNVGLICNVFGKWLGLPKEDIDLVTECGVLHDIGKLKIPEEIIKKPAKLTDDEYKIIKTHPMEGYKILLNCEINDHIRKACLQHHEKADGSGYPFGIKNSQMDFYAKIVAIADVYEAMTAVRIYRGSLSPFQVIDAFEREGLQKYDTHMIMTFLQNIADTYMLNRVKLSDGREGDIVFINKQRLSKPMVKCGNEFVDLTKEPDVYISAIL